MHTGIVKMWNSQRGFGFIITDEEDEFFVNVNDLHPSINEGRLIEGQKVKFDIRNDMKGDRAINVRLVR